ncbi:unnamed protein product [Closterium sp. NIES-53]
MASRSLVSGLPRSLPPLPPGPAPTCIPCVEGWQRAAPHSSTFPPNEAPLQTLHMDVLGPARVRGQSHKRYFLLVVDEYSRYTTVFPLRSKGEVPEVLINWIRQTFTLPASPEQNGIAERRIGMVMDVTRTSMIHAAAPHFLWPFTVQYAAHQINLQPRVSLPETTPTLRWTGKLTSRAVPCVFLRFPPDAPGWQFYHPTSYRVLSSQDVTFDESVSYYCLFPYRTASLPPPPAALPSTRGAEPAGAGTGGVRVKSGSTHLLVSPPVAPDSPVAPPPWSPLPATPSWHALPPPCLWSSQVSAFPPALACPALPSLRRGAAARRSSLLVSPDDCSLPLQTLHMDVWGPARVSGQSRERYFLLVVDDYTRYTMVFPLRSKGEVPDVLIPWICAVRLQLRERFREDLPVLRLHSDRGAVGLSAAQGAASGGAASGSAEPGEMTDRDDVLNRGGLKSGAEPAGAEPGDAEPEGLEPGGAESEGAESGGAEPRGIASSGGPAVSAASDTGAGGVGVPAGAGGTGGTAAAGLGGARTRGTGAAGTGSVGGAEFGRAGAGGAGAGGAGAGGTGAGGARAGGAGAGDTGAVGAELEALVLVALALEELELETLGLLTLELEVLEQGVLGLPSSTGLTPPLLCPPPDLSQPPLQPASPLLAPSPYTKQTGGLTERCEPVSCLASPVRVVCTGRRVPRPRPPFVTGTHAMALCLSSIPLRVPLPPPPTSSLPTVPHPESDRARAASPAVSRLLATVLTDPSFESTAESTLVVELVDFATACCLDYATALVAESESASPSSVGGECAFGTDVLEDRQEDLECLATAGSLHEEIWVRRLPCFTRSFPAGTQWSLRRPVYGLRQAPREWHDTLRTTLAALGLTPSTTDPSLFLRTYTSLPLFYVLVYADDLVFATDDTKALTLVKSELQKRHTCTDLGAMAAQELRWLTYLLSDLGEQPCSPPILLLCFSCDRLFSPTLPMGVKQPPGSPPMFKVYAVVICGFVSAEAEIYAGAMVAQELLWLTLLTNLAAGAGGAAGVGAGDPGARVTGAGGAGPGDAGAVGAGSGDTGQPRPYFVPLLQQVLGLPSSIGLTPPLLCPPPDQSQPPLQPASPLPAPSPYTEHTGGLTQRRQPVSRPASHVRAVRTGRHVP